MHVCLFDIKTEQGTWSLLRLRWIMQYEDVLLLRINFPRTANSLHNEMWRKNVVYLSSCLLYYDMQDVQTFDSMRREWKTLYTMVDWSCMLISSKHITNSSWCVMIAIIAHGTDGKYVILICFGRQLKTAKQTCVIPIPTWMKYNIQIDDYSRWFFYYAHDDRWWKKQDTI